MKVKLAVQVLSKTVSTCLLECSDPSVVGTAMLWQMVNDFFDCTNVRSTSEHERKRNERIKLYENTEDERLKNVCQPACTARFLFILLFTLVTSFYIRALILDGRNTQQALKS
jgi:hypothetical protein